MVLRRTSAVWERVDIGVVKRHTVVCLMDLRREKGSAIGSERLRHVDHKTLARQVFRSRCLMCLMVQIRRDLNSEIVVVAV